MYEITFYETQRKICPIDKFLNELQPKVKAKIEKWMEKLEKEGPNLPRPYADFVRGKIRELIIDFGSNTYRILYFFFRKKIVITHGFVKKTNKTPVREIERAERIMADFLNRYQKGEIEI